MHHVETAKIHFLSSRENTAAIKRIKISIPIYYTANTRVCMHTRTNMFYESKKSIRMKLTLHAGFGFKIFYPTVPHA